MKNKEAQKAILEGSEAHKQATIDYHRREITHHLSRLRQLGIIARVSYVQTETKRQVDFAAMFRDNRDLSK